jgi:hypothetical protein
VTRELMLKLLRGLKKPFVEDAGTCVAGFDVDVATADGAGTACLAWGSRDVEGPVRLTRELRDRIRAADPDSEEDLLEDLDEDLVAVYRAMIAARCKTEVDYFHMLTSEDGERFFSTDHGKVYGEWAGHAAQNAELAPWAEIEDEKLEEWVRRLGLGRKRAPAQKSKSRTRSTGRKGS